MPDIHPTFLATSGERTLAAQMIGGVTGAGTEARNVVADTLDLTAQAVLTAAGVSDPAEQRAILGALWGRP